MIYDIYSKRRRRRRKSIDKKKELVIVDYREKNSYVPAKLIKKGLEIRFKELKIGDYIVKDTVIERKSFPDFIASVIDGRLKRQIKEIKQYPNQLLIIEKTGELSPQLKGTVLSALIDHKIPLLFTKNEEETAEYIRLLSKREKHPTKINPTKINLSDNERLLYILQGFPKIGPKRSKRLLEKFKTLRKIFNSNKEDLIPLVGKTSEEFIKIINKEFRPKKSDKSKVK